MVANCPCGNERKYNDCCEPIISGRTQAPTPEALMRARYSAYENGEIDFLLRSLHPEGAEQADRDSTKAWSESAEWHGLEVLGSSGGGSEDELGEVEFVAKYSLQGEPQRHHEKARFKRHNGHWRYLDGDQIHPRPIVGPKLRLGRNDTCVCGSTRKYKKCCHTVFDAGALEPDLLVRARFTAVLVGESRFLERSLHPEAKQEQSGAGGDEPPTALEVLGVQKQGDEAQVRVTLRADGEGPTEQVQIVKKLGQRWLFVRSEQTAVS
jgi:SEC-C motif domain protein